MYLLKLEDLLKTKTWLDEKVVKEGAPDIYRLALKESKPFDSYTIRILKEEKK